MADSYSTGNSMEESIAHSVCRDYAELSGDRGTLESHWDEIAELTWPAMRNTFRPENSNTLGEKKTEKQLDATPEIASEQFAAVLDSLLTPRTQTWHRLTSTNEYLNKNREVQLYFDEVTRILFRYRNAGIANFSSQNLMTYRSLGTFGIGALYVDRPMGESGLRYKSCPIGEIYVRENHQGMVDFILRRFELTARQAYQREEWRDKLPKCIVDAAKAKPDTKFTFYHRVMRREDLDPSRLDARGKIYQSVYVAEKEKTLLSEMGFNVKPYIVPRYSQAPGEAYGRSPAMMALPAIKTLMEQKRAVLMQAHRAVKPVLLLHDDGVMGGMNLTPGAQNYGGVNADGKELVKTLPFGRVDIGLEMMDQERAIINSAFLLHLFQILAENPRMTATEVIERAREKGILLAPQVGRVLSEYHDPMIEREIDLLAQQRLLPEPPQVLIEADSEYRVIYDSPLSRAMRAEEAAGFVRVMQTLTEQIGITGDPSPLDNFDMDMITREVSDIQAIPTRWLRSEEDRDAIRQDRAKQQERQMQVQEAPGAAALMKAGAQVQGGKK